MSNGDGFTHTGSIFIFDNRFSFFECLNLLPRIQKIFYISGAVVFVYLLAALIIKIRSMSMASSPISRANSWLEANASKKTNMSQSITSAGDSSFLYRRQTTKKITKRSWFARLKISKPFRMLWSGLHNEIMLAIHMAAYCAFIMLVYSCIIAFHTWLLNTKLYATTDLATTTYYNNQGKASNFFDFSTPPRPYVIFSTD
ncbi:hypothetical protein NEDG_01710 [Nematocida displodere]|uniref:Uncharacterized protein n=1 Tax=Nematocida displodere TaxID=1805483 RepID=A0A177EDV9_9MICR|nr:hypothetical protein NEDG_01710 [Nematocida displodere]